MSTVTGVSAADETPVPGRGPSGRPLQGDRASTRRFGDRLFGGTSTAAGLTVIALVSLIALFLVVQAVPAVLADQANFFTSREWSPGGDQPRFGIVEFLWTTVASSTIAMLLAVPVGVAVALFLTQYAPLWMRRPAAALVDLLAAVPSIVYGLWGLITFGPFIKPLEALLQDRLGWFPLFAHTSISGGTIFFIGIVLAIMVLPIVTALSREVFDQTPVTHKEGALALGATRWEMIRTAVLPFGRPGVISAAMLALGRALGETIAVTFLVSALPDGARWTWSLFNGGETFAWDEASTYVRRPPYFDGMSREPGVVSELEGARCLVSLGDSVTTDHISRAGSIRPDAPAGRYLVDRAIERADFNSYGSRRGNHEVMVRGTFANVRLRNLLVPDSEGTWTLHVPSGEEMTIFEASERYLAEGTPTIVVAGKEYGSGSSRDWAAKGPNLLGVRAVIAESYERIHRSNLLMMGILPLQFADGETPSTLGLTGREEFAIEGIENGEAHEVTVRADGVEFRARVRLDTPREREYLRHGGILRFVLRRLLAS